MTKRREDRPIDLEAAAVAWDQAHEQNPTGRIVVVGRPAGEPPLVVAGEPPAVVRPAQQTGRRSNG